MFFNYAPNLPPYYKYTFSHSKNASLVKLLVTILVKSVPASFVNVIIPVSSSYSIVPVVQYLKSLYTTMFLSKLTRFTKVVPSL